MARVTAVDNSMIRRIGPVKDGEQRLEVEIRSGKFAGLLIFKFLMPALLKGANPVWLSLLVVTVLQASVIFLISGYGRLDLTGLFVAGVFIASSGAVNDLAVDIAAAMNEVREKRPDIGRAELLASGLTVAGQVVGTMTNTLLLAYSGGYMALIMTFIAQGVPLANVLNMVLVSAELVHTLVGSLGLVLVAPLTAAAGGLILAGGRKRAFGPETETLP